MMMIIILMEMMIGIPMRITMIMVMLMTVRMISMIIMVMMVITMITMMMMMMMITMEMMDDDTGVVCACYPASDQLSPLPAL